MDQKNRVVSQSRTRIMKTRMTTAAVSLVALAAVLTGCAKPPTPEVRVIKESDIKVGVKGETLTSVPAPAEK
jgi:hypothetical protein